MALIRKGVPRRGTPWLLTTQTRSAESYILLFDVVNYQVNVLVATGVDSGSREYVQSLAGRIDRSSTRQTTAVSRAGSLRARSLRAGCRGQIRSYRARGRL